MIDTRLKVFRSVAQNLSFTKAAQELYISQPAISKHIQELESRYETRLFDRRGNHISLTKSGRILLSHCEKIINAYHRLDFDMHALLHHTTGVLRIGASTTISQYELPEILAQFVKEYPQVELSVLSDNSREIERALLRGSIDLAMVEGIARLPQLHYSFMMSDELVAVVGKTFTTQSDTLTLKDLLSTPLVLRERGSGTLDVIESELKKHQLSLSAMNIKMYLGSTESIKRFVAHSQCMGIISIRAARHEILRGELRVIDIEDLEIKRDFVFIEKQGEKGGLPTLFKQFAEAIIP